MRKLCAAIGTLAFLLSGCSAHTTIAYTDRTPQLDLRRYLDGHITAKGVLFDPTGKVTVSFHVDMKGEWDGNTGTLKEHFQYNDGRKEDRTWTVHFKDDHTFTATADDVVGTAHGTQHGNAVNMRYTLNIKRANGKTLAVSMDDWMYLLDERTLFNRTKISKFGLKVGELMITFDKMPPHES